MPDASHPRLKPPFRPQRIRRALEAICWGATVVLVGCCLTVAALCAPYGPPPVLGGFQGLCILLAFVFLLEQLVIRLVPLRWALATLTFLLVAGMALGVCQLFSLDVLPAWLGVAPPQPGPPRAPHPDAPPPARIGIYRYDDRLGFDHKAGVTGSHRARDFAVTYTIDVDGCRVTPDPAPEARRGSVLLTGGSFTFGHGVEDRECFPYLLGAEHWPAHKIENRAVCGYGTVHAYLQVSDRLAAGDRERPKLVLYAMIPGHVVRNYLRKSYVRMILTMPHFQEPSPEPEADRRGYPHFELRGGELEYRGVVGPDDTVEDSWHPDLSQTEFALTEAFLKGIQAKCRARGVPFAVVVLPEKGGDKVVRASVLAILDRQGIRYLDLTQMQFDTFPHDPHPTPADHQRIADAIAGSFITQMLEGGK